MRYAPHVMTQREKKRKNGNKYISHLSWALKAHSKVILKNSFGGKIKDQFEHLHRDEDTSHWNNIASQQADAQRGNELHWDQQSSNKLTEPQNDDVKKTAKIGTGVTPVTITLIFHSC